MSSAPADADADAGRASLPPIHFIDSTLAAAPCPRARLLALYFSAHWCGPCRGFTPKLRAFYQNTSREDVDIIFVSLDHSSQAFEDYYRGMPWLAADYEKTDREEIYNTLHVRGIPALVVFCPRTGRMASMDGRQDVLQNENNPQACVEDWLQRL